VEHQFHLLLDLVEGVLVLVLPVTAEAEEQDLVLEEVRQRALQGEPEELLEEQWTQ
jgi:hypothetical protein